ncbi:MAG: phosphoesterase, partial [Bacteroidota bacterium]|nr:phosphoesterase [Bacteroidota bacterium]
MKKQIKTIVLLFAAATIVTISCRKFDFQGPRTASYPPDVAVAWMKLQMSLNKTTAGFNPFIGDRTFGYSGLALYESVEPGIPDCQPIVPQLSGFSASSLPQIKRGRYYWPASANAAMALITKDLFANTTAANFVTIDSLEAAFNQQFQSKATTQELQNSVEFGQAVASAIFEWSKSDGGDQAYLHNTDPSYVPPVGPGMWVPTPTKFSPPALPHWGDNRSFIAGIATATQPGPPTVYSAEPKSAFYQMVNELYQQSLNLTHEDSLTAKFWGDIPGNFNAPSHATNILTQLIVLNKLDLGAAAIAYAKHGIAINDASISVFKTKYTYTTIRPISYIRDVMGHTTWNSVIPTPSHPEYTPAHAVASAASALVMDDIFGYNYSFTDHSYDATWGPHTFSSFAAYADEASHSRFLAGIHFMPSLAAGLIQGEKIGRMVNRLR